MIIALVRNLQQITHNGQLAAVVIADQAIIEDTLSDEDFRHIQAMCLYALEISDRQRPGQYTDASADAYARAALARD